MVGEEINGYSGRYWVNKLGKIISLRRYSNGTIREFFLKPYLNSGGYELVGLYDLNMKCKKRLVHQIVAETYLTKPNISAIVHHKNGIRTDNRLRNLEWSNYSRNAKLGFKNGRQIWNKGKKLCGCI